jgi:hypothetical protein
MECSSSDLFWIVFSALFWFSVASGVVRFLIFLAIGR